MKRRRFLTAAVLTLPFLSGCTGTGGDGEQTTTTEKIFDVYTMNRSNDSNNTGKSSGNGEGNVITIEGSSYSPRKAAVSKGSTVEWRNEDSVAHTVTAAQFHDKARSWTLDRELAEGESITHTFKERGVYEYYCTIHGKSTMCGAVLVGDVSLEESLPCAGSG